jgi:hypothetical protein
MTSAREIAINLLRRMLAGERGNLPMHLAMLLEKSSPLHNSDDHYRQILPPELAELRLSPETAKEITSALCTEIRRNPDSAFIFALSFTGAQEVTKAVAEIVINPPRPLTTAECGHALTIVNAFLPAGLARDPHFLEEDKRARLVERLRDLQHAEETIIKRDAAELLKRLTAVADS